jgi:hypothetical protein
MRKTIILLALLLSSAACTYQEGRRHRHHDEGFDPPPPPYEPAVLSSTIDADQGIVVEPGRGVGALIEYTSGGAWRLTTVCDTELSGWGCNWDVIVSTARPSQLSGFEQEGLESNDYLDWESDRSVRLVASTSYDVDGFWTFAEPGAALRVDVYLDGEPAPGYIYWIGDGALHRGAPENPIDLIPSTP